MSERSEASRRFAADSSLVLGGLAAILLQVADPRVAHGVAHSSTFASNPLTRLRHTLAYVYAIGLGAPEQKDAAARRVDAAHARVPGARDPDAQLWVAATLARLSVRTRELLRGPLPPDLAEEVHATSVEFGAALQVPRERWPADRAAFDRYWDDAVARLAVGPEARAIAAELLAARAAPWWVRLAMPAAREFSTLLLPDAVRVAYGIPWHPRRAHAVLALARVASRVIPRRLRELPSRRLLADLRAPRDGAGGRA